MLVALHGLESEPAVILTERRHDLRRHAGEISFPGGRRDPGDRDLEHTALRESHEEIGLDPADVEVIGALPPFGTFVTNYRVHPYVGLIPDGLEWTLSPREVETLLDLRIAELREGFAMQRLVRRGIPFQTPTYTVGPHLVWGATARMLGDLLERMD